MKTPRTQKYFWKIFTTIGAASIGFTAVMATAIAFYMILPLGKLAVNDFTNILLHAAETWKALPPDQRNEFAQKVYNKHEMVITQNHNDIPESGSILPYLLFFKSSLKQKTGNDVYLMQNQDDKGATWFWVDVAIAEETVRFGFPRSRIRVQPSAVFFILISIGSLLIISTAAYIAKRLTAPIEHLSQAAQLIGKGQWPAPIRESGPEELCTLAHEFNRMSTQIRELLANRTTLLAGISHDLRTPLTQIQLALEMLSTNEMDTPLISGIRRDLGSMNNLINQTLEIGMELERKDIELVQASELLQPLVNAARRNGHVVEWSSDHIYTIEANRLALQRVISNLLENAIRYGGNKPVTILCRMDAGQIAIEICDRGPGIPDEQKDAVFQPFYRLEGSRSRRTGGSGLGLAIVRLLANANNWKVTLLDREGGGTCAQLLITN